MPRFFFDIHDGGTSFDEDGVELLDETAVRRQAMQTLPRIAADEIPMNGDRRHFTVLVSDEGGKPVYSATLTYTGLWLHR